MDVPRLCLLSGLSRQLVHWLLSGQTPDPRLSTAQKLAEALGVSLDALRV